jgi:hypothetical protein
MGRRRRQRLDPHGAIFTIAIEAILRMMRTMI